MRLSLIHCANSLLSTPGISKSAAAELLSANVAGNIEPIQYLICTPKSVLMIKGLSNSLRTGCKIFIASAFRISICIGKDYY
jgi:hypothetical protein